MNDDRSDSLDSALFALPLAEPPADLRASILRATIAAPAVPATLFGRLETYALGVVVGIAVWLSILTLTNPRIVEVVESSLASIVAGITDVRTIVWLAVGVITALACSFFIAPLRLTAGPRRP